MASQKRGLTGIHWRAPTVMLSSLAVAIALAIGHHYFYQSLDTTEVESSAMRFAGLATSTQQINTSIGTAFAFFVKSFLVLATSTAYFQLVFEFIQKTHFRLLMLDNWFSGTSNLISLACSSSYWRHPLLPLIAATVWLLPISAIITPAALTVTFDEIRPWRTESLHAPLPAFESLAFDAFTQTERNDPFEHTNSTRLELRYAGPAQEITRIAQAVAFTGNIVSIPPPGVNASWTTDLLAPGLRCENMNATYTQALKLNIRDLMNVSATDNGPVTCGGDVGGPNSAPTCNYNDYVPLMFSYLAWMGTELPFSWNRGMDTRPDHGFSAQDAAASITNGVKTEQGPDFYTLDDYTLGVAVFPRAMHNYAGLYAGQNPWTNDTLIDGFLEDATLLKCKVKSFKYTLRFNYQGFPQDQEIQVLAATEAPRVSTCTSMTAGAMTLTSSDAGLRLVESSCKFDGRDKAYHEWTAELSRQWLSDWSSLATLQAFTSSIIGAQNSEGAEPASAKLYGSNINDMETKVFSTVLADTIDLARVSIQSSNYSALNVTYANSSSDYAYQQALSLTQPKLSTAPRMKLSDALEELFFNTTISFASSEKLRYNSSSPLAPPPVEMTFKTYGNVYAYANTKLWLVYGLAIGITALNVIVGLISMFRTRASFTANFSSIVRLAKNAEIAVDMTEQHLPGRDPCPKHVAAAQLMVCSFDYSPEENVPQGSVIPLSYKPVQQSVQEVESGDSEQQRLRAR